MSDPRWPTYYKATRPDGTDFKTGTVRYELGKRVRPRPYDGQPRICGPGYLHAADVPAMTLVGGWWPCRLFEVTGKPVVGFDAKHEHKGGFRQLTVAREIDAHLALGPNGRYIAGIIERTRKLDAVELGRFYAAWVATRVAARDAARDAVWVATRDAVWDATRDAVWDAVWDATLAVLVRDLITPDQFDVLVKPWENVIGKEYTR